jgi:ubiquinone/menaquinone biosynthesis C-methylase UbiE
MILTVPERRFNPDILEMMDRPGIDKELLRDDLRNLRIINKYFGGHSSIRHVLKSLLGRFPHDRQIEILDLATGSADIPIVILNAAGDMERAVVITAMDRNPVMLQVARELTAGFEQIRVEEGDILRPPFADRSFDLVLCSLALHHFSRQDAVEILRNMRRLARVALVVVDLNRSWLGAWTVWLYTHLAMRNPITLYDSYVSVLRAFTPSELAEMAGEAGIESFRTWKRPFFRMILVGEV